MPRQMGTAKLAKGLGARIRALREEASITQERLAWECELSKAYLSQLEAGKRVASIPVLEALARRLSVEMADLVAFDLSKPRLHALDASRRGEIAEAKRVLSRIGKP